MNIQQQEQGIVSMLLESIEFVRKSKFSDKSLNLFENNFKALYKDVLGLSSLNESVDYIHDEYKPQIKCNNNKNIFAYINKVVDICESQEKTFMRNLNENFRLENGKNDPYDINTYIKYLKKLNKSLLKVNDFDRLSNDITKLKISLNQPIFVYGMNIIDKNHKNLDIILYDKSYKKILYLSQENGIYVYDIKTDNYDDLMNSYNDLDLDSNTINNILSEIKTKSIFPIISMIKENIHGNFIPLYLNTSKMNLKFTDNLYKDQERKSRLQDLIKLKEMSANNNLMNNISNF